VRILTWQQRNITRRDRKAADLLDRIEQLRKDLLYQYEDLPGLRPQEIQLLSQPPAGEDELAEFYKRFEGVKDFHRRNKGINTRQFINDLDELVRGDGLQVVQVEEDEEPMIVEREFPFGSARDWADPLALDSVFSGEEAYGKHLDLYLSHTQYLNLKGSSRLSYFGYLDMLRQGKVERTLDVKEKSLPAYLEYVQTLYNYLVSYFDRALPLTNIHSKIKEEQDKFEAAWTAGEVPGWESEGPKKSAPTGEGIWCPFCMSLFLAAAMC
jgi:splicing factor 3A subunit 3